MVLGIIQLNQFYYTVAAILTALFISSTSIPVIIRIAEMKRLIDEPDGMRKRHKSIIPTLGGIGIFSSFLISFSMWGKAGNLESYPFFVAALLMLFLIGIKDDVLMLSPVKKLIIQTIAAAQIVIGGNLVVTNLDGVLGIHHLSYFIGVIFSIFLIIVIINAYNLIDGIDGLAGGIGMICSTIFGIWFLVTDHFSLAILSFVLTGSLVGFLIYNFAPAKIFMGDTGSMVGGFILSYLVINFINLNITGDAGVWRIPAAPVFAFSILIIPMFDTMRIFFIRSIHGKPPFKADYNHIHHRLLHEGMTHRGASLTLWGANVIIVALSFLLRDLNGNLLLLIVLLLSFMILPSVHLFFKIRDRFKVMTALAK